MNGFVEKLMQGVHSHSNGDKTSFHLEINIMMTLKLVMKHICKRRRGGHGWGFWKEGTLLGCRGGPQGAQSFSEEGIQM